MAGHKQAAVAVPFDPAARWLLVAKTLWPGRRGFAVGGTINGACFDSFIVGRSKKFYPLIEADVQKRLGVSIGDDIAFQIQPRDS